MPRKPKNNSEEIKESDIRVAIWMLKQKKTKKSVCEHLGIAYNTKRLDKIISDFREAEEREKSLREKAKNSPLTEQTKKSIVNSYLAGDTQSAIAKRYYISAARVKNVLLASNVPIRARKKNAPAKTEHIVQDLEVKFKKGDKTFFGEENSFALIKEVYDEDYIEYLKLGRQRWVELVPWTEKSRHHEPVQGIHYEIYWELEDGTSWKMQALLKHIDRLQKLIIETGRETYSIWVEGDYGYKKLFVPRDKLFPVVMQ